MHSKKTIWITGASSGIGQGLAQAFIEQGHFVIVSGRNRQALSELETMAPSAFARWNLTYPNRISLSHFPHACENIQIRSIWSSWPRVSASMLIVRTAVSTYIAA